jgi:transcriptional regulator with XRE-family HTH domain
MTIYAMQKTKPVSRIAILREQEKLTQQELAELLSVTEHTVANWENGRNSLDWIDRVVKLCKIFRCSPDQLIDYVLDTEPIERKTKTEKPHLEKIRKRLNTEPIERKTETERPHLKKIQKQLHSEEPISAKKNSKNSEQLSYAPIKTEPKTKEQHISINTQQSPIKEHNQTSNFERMEIGE